MTLFNYESDLVAEHWWRLGSCAPFPELWSLVLRDEFCNYVLFDHAGVVFPLNRQELYFLFCMFW